MSNPPASRGVLPRNASQSRIVTLIAFHAQMLMQALLYATHRSMTPFWPDMMKIPEEYRFEYAVQYRIIVFRHPVWSLPAATMPSESLAYARQFSMWTPSYPLPAPWCEPTRIPAGPLSYAIT